MVGTRKQKSKLNFNRTSILTILVFAFMMYMLFYITTTKTTSDNPEFVVNERLLSIKEANFISWDTWFPFNQGYELIANLRQNDARILDYIRQTHLYPPSPLPYSLDEPETDSGVTYGLVPIIKRLLKNQTNGFFVEAGSNDGEHISSTLGFERFDSWTGLCVEPSPVMHPIWRSKHRKAWFSDVCLSPKPHPLWTSFLHRIDNSIASKLGKAEDIQNEKVGNWTALKVPCFPLYSILAAMNVKHVDFLNLDVEGVELEVLKTIPFDQLIIKVISVELHTKDPVVRDALCSFMTANGYTKVYENAPIMDYIFALSSIL